MTELNSLRIEGLINLDDDSAEKCVGGAFDIIFRSADGQKTRQRFDGQNPAATISVPDGTTAIRLQNRDNSVGDFRFSFAGENGRITDPEVTTLLPKGSRESRVTLSDGVGLDSTTGTSDGISFPITQVTVTQF